MLFVVLAQRDTTGLTTSEKDWLKALTAPVSSQF